MRLVAAIFAMRIAELSVVEACEARCKAADIELEVVFVTRIPVVKVDCAVAVRKIAALADALKVPPASTNVDKLVVAVCVALMAAELEVVTVFCCRIAVDSEATAELASLIAALSVAVAELVC